VKNDARAIDMHPNFGLSAAGGADGRIDRHFEFGPRGAVWPKAVSDARTAGIDPAIIPKV